MNEIQIFKNAEFGSVRTADINGVPYFVGKDVAEILGYSNTRKALLDHGKFAFVEVKAPGEKPRPLQLARHRLLSCLGFRVYVLDDAEQIGGVLDEIENSM